MNEHVDSAQQHENRKTVPLIVLIAVIIIAGLTAYLLILRSRTELDPAALVPKDIALAVTVDLTKSADKAAAMSYIRDTLKEAGIDEPEEKLFDSIDKKFNISVKKDVLRHLNGVGAFAVLTEMNGDMPSMAAVIGTKSDNDAKKVMANLGNKLNADNVKFSRLSYSKYYFYRIPTTGQATSYIGQVKSSIVYATSESGMKKVIDTADGKPSLLDDENFISLRMKNDSTFGCVYYTGAGYYKLIEPQVSTAAALMGKEIADWFKKNTENTIAAVGNAEASADGLKLNCKIITKASNPRLEETDIDNLATNAPKDAAVVCSTEDWKTIWSEIKGQLASNPAIKQQIDTGLMQARQMLQIDPYTDVLDRITAVGIYYTPAPINKAKFPGHLTFVLTVDKPDVIKKSMSRIHDAMAMSGEINLKPANVAGVPVNIGSMGNAGQFGDALAGDKAIITISGVDVKSGLQSAIATINGKSSTASAADGFKLVKNHLPGKSTMLFYVNFEPMFSAFASGSDKKTAAAIMKRVSVMGAASTISGTKSESVLVIPFKK